MDQTRQEELRRKASAYKHQPARKEPNGPRQVYEREVIGKRKDKTVAILLAFFLGGLGIHKFYLGKPVQGVLFFLFSWTLIPAIVGLVDGFRYIFMSNQKWNRKMNPSKRVERTSL